MYKIYVTFIFLLLSACSRDRMLEHQITHTLSSQKMGVADLSKIGSSSWQRLCILKPYTTNKYAEQILGFQWDVETKTSISSNDEINVLLFINADSVEKYIEFPRSKGDFTTLTSDCLSRDKTQVSIKNENGWITIHTIN